MQKVIYRLWKDISLYRVIEIKLFQIKDLYRCCLCHYDLKFEHHLVQIYSIFLEKKSQKITDKFSENISTYRVVENKLWYLYKHLQKSPIDSEIIFHYTVMSKLNFSNLKMCAGAVCVIMTLNLDTEYTENIQSCRN